MVDSITVLSLIIVIF